MSQYFAKTSSVDQKRVGGQPGPASSTLPLTALAVPFLAVLYALFLSPIARQATAAERPNIVMILADDQGWGDLSLHGNTNLSTPNIDSLAADGVAFENFYVSAVCAPTRAEMLTGRYFIRTGVRGVTRGEERLNLDEITIADTFQKAGYRTGAFGKWHNGSQPPYHPNDRGFDEYYGFTSGHWGTYFEPPLDHNNTAVKGKGYLVDDLTNHAIDFIEENKSEPFFCYVPLNTPHSPMHIPDRFYEKFDGVDLKMRNRDPEKEDELFSRAALAMVENIDWNVGRILQVLDEQDLAENTIVIYFSDNGPNSWRWNGDMKGRKGSIDEGGIRVPCLIRWPGKLAPGKKIDQVAAAIDFLPTLSDLANVELISEKRLDGRSLEPLLLSDGKDWQDRALLSFRKGASLRTQRFRIDGAGKLFDIENDRSQRHPVNEKFPKVSARMQDLLAKQTAEMKQIIATAPARPFTVGYGKRTVLPARDGEAKGGVQRSARAPNNSFFTNWIDPKGAIEWNIEVGESGPYHVVVHHTCPTENVGTSIRVAIGDATAVAKVDKAFDPPLQGAAQDRASRGSESYVKDFAPLDFGMMDLEKGVHTLRLSTEAFVGGRSIDVHSVELTK